MIRKTKCITATTFSRGCARSWDWTEEWRESWSWFWCNPESGSWPNTWEKSRCWGRTSR